MASEHGMVWMREVADIPAIGSRVTLWQCEECKKVVTSRSNEPICYGNRVVHD